MAMSLLLILPMVVLFVAFQRYFVAGAGPQRHPLSAAPHRSVIDSTCQRFAAGLR
jgi:hypothetical protein